MNKLIELLHKEKTIYEIPENPLERLSRQHHPLCGGGGACGACGACGLRLCGACGDCGKGEAGDITIGEMPFEYNAKSLADA